ncbi:MAG TPA: hypothetical protein VG722_09465 [Tepidisphaeraceae bacterium]|nr:hypothetical protein [Tepidisphaeraceae bacterium]
MNRFTRYLLMLAAESLTLPVRADIITSGAVNPNPPQQGQSLTVGDGAAGILDVNDASAVDPSSLEVGRAGGAGQLNIDNGSVNGGSEVIVANAAGTAGTTGAVDVRGAGTITSNGLFLLGNGNATTATVHLDQGSSIVSDNDIRIGALGTNSATLNVTGGSSVTSHHYLQIGHATGSNGTLTLDGASTVTASSLCGIGDLGGSVGFVTVDGGSSMSIGGMMQIGIYPDSAGTLNLNNGSINVGNGLVVGLKGNANLSIAAGSSITVPVNGVIFGNASSSQATVNFGLGHNQSGDPIAGLITAYQLLIRSGISTLNLSFDPNETFNVGDKFTLVDYDSTNWNGGTFANVGNDQLLSVNNHTFRIDYNDLIAPGDYALTATVVPLPTAAWGGISLLGGMAGFITSRTRRSARPGVL